MIRAEVVPYCLPLKRAWVAASAILTERRGALLKLTDADGRIGWGDCAPLPSCGNAGAVLAALDDYARRPARFLDARRPAGADFSALPPEVRWAVETARLDIEAQRQSLPLARLLNPDAPPDIAINAALGPLDEACVERAQQALAQDFSLGKIKVGLAPVELELARLQALAEATQGRLRLRLDANRAWSVAEAGRFLNALRELPVEAVEEPLAAPDLATYAALQSGLPYALALDESLPPVGLEAVIATRAVRRLVLKPARLGGHAATQAIARLAAAAGIETVLTSVVDSAVGITAAAHLAAAIAPALAHGLGTSAWLADDVAATPVIANGRLQLPDTPGLGIRA